jgi:hypothetical protein
MALDEKTFTPVVGSDGKATVSVRVTNGIDTWTVQQVSLEMPAAPAGAAAWVRKNGYPVSPAVATGDTVADAPPVLLRPSDVLTVEWTGCTVGISGKVVVSYDDGRPA